MQSLTNPDAENQLVKAQNEFVLANLGVYAAP